MQMSRSEVFGIVRDTLRVMHQSICPLMLYINARNPNTGVEKKYIIAKYGPPDPKTLYYTTVIKKHLFFSASDFVLSFYNISLVHSLSFQRE